MNTHAVVLTRITASIGVEIQGIDLQRESGPSIDSTGDMLRTAVAEHHVVVLRGQHLSESRHGAVASAFGTIMASPVQLATHRGREDGSAVTTIEDTAQRPPAGFPWHTDVSWIAEPPAFGFLSAVHIPAFGGDTMWASTAAVFDALSPMVQERCQRSTILHAPDPSLLASIERHHGREVADRLSRDHPGIEHPLVSIHPRTGRKSLFLSPLSAKRIIGPAGADRSLLAHLHVMLEDPHMHMRWRWSEGDFVMWDERATCHRALTDHYPQRRIMRRCVVAAR